MFENYVNSNSQIGLESKLSTNSNNLITENNEENEKLINDTDSSNMKYSSNTNKKDYSNIQNLKELMYKVYATSVDKAKDLQIAQKKKMKKLISLLIYLQMRKIEMKLMYFNEFEKIIQYESQQLKSKESQIIQERLKLAFKKADILSLSNKFKELTSQIQEKDKIEIKDISNIDEINTLIEEANKVRVNKSENMLDLNC